MRLALSALTVLASLAIPVVAHADAIDTFTLTGTMTPKPCLAGCSCTFGCFPPPTPLSLSFSLPASPTPNSDTYGGGFAVGPVDFFYDHLNVTAVDITFFADNDYGFGYSIHGGFLIEAGYAPYSVVATGGPQLFTGSPNHQTFKTGEFTLSGSDVYGPYNYTIDITPETAATPEPGSLVLLGTGALGALGMLRRRLTR